VSLTPSVGRKGDADGSARAEENSPSAPAGTSNCLPLVTGTEHAGVGHNAVTFAGSFTGTGSALTSPT